MLDHGSIRGDHLNDLDYLSVAHMAEGYTPEQTQVAISHELHLLYDVPPAECMQAAEKIVYNAMT